ncbi:hypothetical protein [Pedobacter nyackensis]|uniref:hypothetical protein n=1 Tax=Pedobacter nyackensis TaxID=475255 RepID=UPI00292D4941|nr:hypothetical protein [Pedobacter nyackensis]
MQIVSAQKIDMSHHGITTACAVYLIHVKILDIKKRAKSIIDTITNRSWITSLGPIDRVSYDARAEKTIKKIVENILMKVDDKVTSDFGEYLVSDSAGNALNIQHGHTKIALAELWKEQASGNPGFDFHTESSTELIIYGEAKFKTSDSPYTLALDQIVNFVDDKKDLMELTDLKNFCSANAITNALNHKKGFIAAFSLNAVDHNKIFEKALKTASAQKLMVHNELYLIGVQV